MRKKFRRRRGARLKGGREGDRRRAGNNGKRRQLKGERLSCDLADHQA
jgi:hypothetical protein